MDGWKTSALGVLAAVLLIGLLPPGCSRHSFESPDGYTYVEILHDPTAHTCVAYFVDDQPYPGEPMPIRAGRHTVRCQMSTEFHQSTDFVVTEGTVYVVDDWVD